VRTSKADRVIKVSNPHVTPLKQGVAPTLTVGDDPVTETQIIAYHYSDLWRRCSVACLIV
jgi:hypothetical protein